MPHRAQTLKDVGSFGLSLLHCSTAFRCISSSSLVCAASVVIFRHCKFSSFQPSPSKHVSISCRPPSSPSVENVQISVTNQRSPLMFDLSLPHIVCIQEQISFSITSSMPTISSFLVLSKGGLSLSLRISPGSCIKARRSVKKLVKIARCLAHSTIQSTEYVILRPYCGWQVFGFSSPLLYSISFPLAYSSFLTPRRRQIKT